MIIEEKATHAGDLRRLVNSDPLMVMDRACLLRPGDEERQHRSRSNQSCFSFLWRHRGDSICTRQSIVSRHDDLSVHRAKVGYAILLTILRRSSPRSTFRASSEVRLFEVFTGRVPAGKRTQHRGRENLKSQLYEEFSCVRAFAKFLLALSPGATATHEPTTQLHLVSRIPRNTKC